MADHNPRPPAELDVVVGLSEDLSAAPAARRTRTSDENQQQPRRTNRERTSTVVYIDGQPVLTKNNYVLKGMSYEYRTTTALELEPPRKPTSKKNSAPSSSADGTKTQPPKKPRTVSQAEIDRKQHNARVVARKESKQALRQSFLHRCAETLAPFLSDEALERLRRLPTIHVNHAEIFSQPESVVGELRDYQLQGLNFMVRMHRQNLGMILGDEMGLGKTLQTISLLCYLKEREGVSGPSLIVAPLSVLSSWCTELTKWAPHFKFLRLHSADPVEQESQRKTVADDGHSFDTIVTTYDMVKVKALQPLFQRHQFNYLVLDEGHKIKGHTTIIAEVVRKIHCENKLILTGTPLQNNLVELWSLLEFLYPAVFTDKKPFENAFNLKENHVDKEMLLHAQKVLDLFMLRRLKDQVEKLLPPKLETKVYCPLSSTQAFWYKAILMKDLGSLANATHRDEVGEELNQGQSAILRNLFMQLRKCCQHPFLFEGSEQHPGQTTVEDLTGMSGKLAVLDMLLRSLCTKGHRAVLFSQFTMVLDIIEDYCNLRGWKFCRLDGATSRAMRNYIVQQFNSDNSPFFLFLMSTKSGGMGLNLQSADTCILYDSDVSLHLTGRSSTRFPCFCRLDGATSRAMRNYIVQQFNSDNSPFFLFLMSTKSGGMGLNLQSADTCILYDSDWNPQNDLQAMARVHRIGQTKPVHIYRLVTAGTIEERILERAEKKLLLGQTVNRENDRMDDATTGLSSKELLADIKFGCAAIFGENSKNELPTSEDIDLITDRTRSEADEVGNLRSNAATAESFDAEREFSATQIFGGVDFRAIRQAQERKERDKTPKNMAGIAHLWQEISSLKEKRTVKNRVIFVDGKGMGYGKASVPVLASNNYDLEHGESSVFDREFSHKNKSKFAVPKTKREKLFENQDVCQSCLDGGTLILCPRCPVSLHLECCGMTREKDFLCCSHHNCTNCNKSSLRAGGLLYPCQSCTLAWCEDCLPIDSEGFRFLGECERFKRLGFNSTKNSAYIHCSRECELFAAREFGWVPKDNQQECPNRMDFSKFFGFAAIDACPEQSSPADEETAGRPRRRAAARKVASYRHSQSTSPSTSDSVSASSTYNPSPSQGSTVGKAAKTQVSRPPEFTHLMAHVPQVRVPASTSNIVMLSPYKQEPPRKPEVIDLTLDD